MLPGSAGWQHRARQRRLRCLPAAGFVVSTCCGVLRSRARGATRTAAQALEGSVTTGGATAIKEASRSLCQLLSTAVGHLRTGREAAGLRSLLPASICKELVQSWRRASSTKLRLAGELQESGSERTLRRNGDEATPVENSSAQRPPTSRPNTTRRQRRLRSISGYVCRRLRRAALRTAQPGWLLRHAGGHRGSPG